MLYRYCFASAALRSTLKGRKVDCKLTPPAQLEPNSEESNISDPADTLEFRNMGYGLYPPVAGDHTSYSCLCTHCPRHGRAQWSL